MDYKQNTVEFHPQAEQIKAAYKEAAKQRAEKYAKLFEYIKVDPKKADTILPRPLVYCLPTGNRDFDNGIEYLTPQKDPHYGIKGGGIPVGKITVFSGRSGVGKSQFIYTLCKNAKFNTLYVDTEGGIIDDQKENVMVYSSEILEDCWTVVFAAIDSGHFNCIVIDSLTNLKTRANMQKEDGEMPQMGERAKVVGEFLNKLCAKLVSNDVAVIIVSQERDSMEMFRRDPVLPGGAQVLYASSLILGLLSNKSDEIKDKESGLKVGQKTKVKVRKNRFGPDNCEFQCKIMFNGGDNGK